MPFVCLLSYLRDNLVQWVMICIWCCSGRGFAESSITISGLKAQLRPEWTSDTYGTRFTATVHPIGTGPLLVAVAARAATDASGNTNLRPSAESKVVQEGPICGVSFMIASIGIFLSFRDGVGDRWAGAGGRRGWNGPDVLRWGDHGVGFPEARVARAARNPLGRLDRRCQCQRHGAPGEANSDVFALALDWPKTLYLILLSEYVLLRVIGAQRALDIFIFLETNLGLSEIMAMTKGTPHFIHFILSCTNTVGLAEAPSLESAFFCQT
eukprot:scaffold283136_cov15-Prasinocladus_malaysianus.AAC.1